VSQAGFKSNGTIADFVPFPKTAVLAAKTEKMNLEQWKFGRIANSVFVP
jgi:hypothetical protein